MCVRVCARVCVCMCVYICTCFMNEEYIAEQLNWIVLDCTSAPYGMGDESMYISNCNEYIVNDAVHQENWRVRTKDLKAQEWWWQGCYMSLVNDGSWGLIVGGMVMFAWYRLMEGQWCWLCPKTLSAILGLLDVEPTPLFCVLCFSLKKKNLKLPSGVVFESVRKCKCIVWIWLPPIFFLLLNLCRWLNCSFWL